MKKQRCPDCFNRNYIFPITSPGLLYKNLSSCNRSATHLYSVSKYYFHCYLKNAASQFVFYFNIYLLSVFVLRIFFSIIHQPVCICVFSVSIVHQYSPEQTSDLQTGYTAVCLSVNSQRTVSPGFTSRQTLQSSFDYHAVLSYLLINFLPF